MTWSGFSKTRTIQPLGEIVWTNLADRMINNPTSFRLSVNYALHTENDG